MDPPRYRSNKGFLSPQVMALIGTVLGIIFGLVYAWLISPVELIDLDVPQLRDDLKLEYLRITIDSYSLNHEALQAITRYDRLGEDAITYLAEIEFTPSGQSPNDIESFRDLVVSPTQGEESEESSDEISGIEILKWALLVLILLAAALVIRHFLRQRSLNQMAPQAAVSESQVITTKLENTNKTSGLKSIIEVNKLTKYYGKARGIVDVSFNVDEGMWVAGVSGELDDRPQVKCFIKLENELRNHR